MIKCRKEGNNIIGYVDSKRYVKNFEKFFMLLKKQSPELLLEINDVRKRLLFRESSPTLRHKYLEL